jgi:hypothetical protein
MTGSIPTFHAGQCIDAASNPMYPTKLLSAGKIYVVRAIDCGPSWKAPHWGVHLKGIVIYYPCTDNTVQWAFNPNRFRPIVERRPTDITLFREILAGLRELPLHEEGWL